VNKNIIKIVTLFVLTLIAGFAFADPNSASGLAGKGFFTISPSDISVGMLSRLFGDVGIVLPGAPGLMGALFAKFNEAVLIIIVLTTLAYTLFRSVIETAHHGEFLGKKFDSLWVPIRVVMGVGLIVPTVTGYSIIQIVVMWVVMQGVGAADVTWKTALVYLQNHNHNIIPKSDSNWKNNTYTPKVGQSLLSGMLCMEKNIQQNYPNYNTAPMANPIMNISNASSGTNNISFYIPANKYPKIKYNVNCGSVSWPNPKQYLPHNGQPGNKNNYQKFMAIQDAVTQLKSTLVPTAKNMVYLSSQDIFQNKYSDQSGFNPVAIASNYLNTAVYTAQPNNQFQGLSDGMWNQAYMNGWAMAGSYYYDIGKVSKVGNDAVSIGTNDISVDQACGNPGSPTGWLSKACKVTAPLVTKMWSPTTGANGGVYNNGNSTSTSNAHGLNFNVEPGSKDPFTVAIATPMMDSIANSFASHMSNSTDNSKDGGTNPVVALVQFGQSMVNSVQQAITAISYTIIATGGVMAMCAAIQPGMGILMGLMMIALPLIFMMIIPLYMVAIMLAYYVPLVPYIIFFFGVIGWLLAVLESILAAPLVALGVTYPEGHEMFGRADPALMLLTNIFFRPTFMIFGLLAGMILSYVGLNFLNSTFAGVLNSVTGGGSIDPFVMISVLVIYGGLVVVFFHKTFSLIHVLPDTILRWIGGQGAQFGEYAGGEQSVRGAAQQSAEKGTQAAQQAGQSSVEMGKGISGSNQGGGQSASPESSSSPDVNPSSDGGSAPPPAGV
jgi:defect in organelle trafficking protein DotA